MKVDELMVKAGFTPLRNNSSVTGYQRASSTEVITRVIVIPVNGKSIDSLQQDILICYYDENGTMQHNMFFDSLRGFFDSQGLEWPAESLQPASQSRQFFHFPIRALALFFSASCFLCRRVLLGNSN